MDPIKDFKGAAGVVVDPMGGVVDEGPGTPGVLDGLAQWSAAILHMREDLARIPNIGDWRLGSFGSFDTGLVQLLPNADRLKKPSHRESSAEVVMSWLKGEWKVVNHVSRAGKVVLGGLPTVIVLHNVDGVVIEQPASGAKGGTDA